MPAQPQLRRRFGDDASPLYDRFVGLPVRALGNRPCPSSVRLGRLRDLTPSAVLSVIPMITETAPWSFLAMARGWRDLVEGVSEIRRSRLRAAVHARLAKFRSTQEHSSFRSFRLHFLFCSRVHPLLLLHCVLEAGMRHREVLLGELVAVEGSRFLKKYEVEQTFAGHSRATGHV